MAEDPRMVVVKNLFIIRQLENSMGDLASEAVAEMFEEIVGLVAKMNPAGVISRYQQIRLASLLDAIQAEVGPGMDGIRKEIRANLVGIGKQMGERARMQLIAILGTEGAGVETAGLTVNYLKTLIDRDPFQGATLDQWFAKIGTDARFRIRQQLQLGLSQGETLDGLLNRIRGRPVGKGYTGGVWQATERDAVAVTRTAVNDIANTAALETFGANADIAPEYEIVATLDMRTSDICKVKDGKRFRLDDPKAERPPFHVNCRTTVVPIVDWKALGLEPPEEGTRASMRGQVDASTDYEGWLHMQPASIQDEILGPGRGALFRSGKVGLQEMIKSDGRRIPLDRLAA